MEQRILRRDALDVFHGEGQFALQIEHFKECYNYDRDSNFTLLDVGGGVGYFVLALQQEFPNMRATILDLDESAISKAKSNGLDAVVGSVLKPPPSIHLQKFDIVCFNEVLHHIIAASDRNTCKLQQLALLRAKGLASQAGSIFINELCYEGKVFSDSSSAIIFHLLTNPLLSKIVASISAFVPSLKANTVGVGIRFRPYGGWVRLIESAGFQLSKKCEGAVEKPSFAKRLLLNIRHAQRVSVKVQVSR